MVVPRVLAEIHPELYLVAVAPTTFDQLSEHTLFLMLGAFTAIYGTHTINTLRTEAYEGGASSTSIDSVGGSAAAGWVRFTLPNINCSSDRVRSS